MSDFTLSSPVNSNQSVQGQLSSQYTNWVQDQVQHAADAIAHRWFEATGKLDLDTALAIRAALEQGNFSVDGLFLANNGKSSLGNDLAGEPDPTLTVAGQTIDLADLFSGTKVTEWTSGNAKNVQYHAREYFTSFDAGSAPDGWDQPPPSNDPPVATPFEVGFEETQSEFKDHVRTNEYIDVKTIDLRNGASDSDLLQVTGTVLVNGLSLDNFSYITLEGNELKIDVNSRDLDLLKASETDPDHALTLTVTYQLTDDVNGPVETHATITITGTTDEYEGSDKGSISKTYTGRANTADTLSPNTQFDHEKHADGFDFTYTGGTITVTQTDLSGNEQSQIVDEGTLDWGSDPLKVGKVGQSFVSEATKELLDTALADGKVDYKVNNNSIGDGDTVTVTLDYRYDYWYLA